MLNSTYITTASSIAALNNYQRSLKQWNLNNKVKYSYSKWVLQPEPIKKNTEPKISPTELMDFLQED